MASMHVSLSETMKNWVEQQISGGNYHNASEYIRDLIRRDQTGQMRLEALRTHLAEGENDIAAGRFDTLSSKEDISETFAGIKRGET